MWNLLMRSWRWRSPKIYSWHVETQENWCINSRPGPKAWESDRQWYYVSPSSRARRRLISQLSQEEEANSSFLYLFLFFFQAFDRWDDAHPHWGGSSVFLNLLIQMLICFGNTLTDILRNNVQPNIWAFHGPVKLRDSTFALAQTLPRWSPPDTYPQKTLDKIPSKDLI